MNIQQSLSAPTLENVQNVRRPLAAHFAHLQSLRRPLAARFATLAKFPPTPPRAFYTSAKPPPRGRRMFCTFFKAVFEEAEHTFLHFGGGLSENKTNFGGELINPIVKINPYSNMRTIVKIKEFGITRLNNAEYTNFSTRVLTLVEQAGTLEPDGGSALGIPSWSRQGRSNPMAARHSASRRRCRRNMTGCVQQ